MFRTAMRSPRGHAIVSFAFVAICVLLASGIFGPYVGIDTPLAGRGIFGWNFSQDLVSDDEKSTFYGNAHLVKRLDTATYNSIVSKGAGLDCLFSTSVAGATSRLGYSIEVTGYLLESLFELEGWREVANNVQKDAPLPLFRNYLDTAFRGLGIDKGTGAPGSSTSNIYMANWADFVGADVLTDPGDMDSNVYEKQPTGAYFFNDFIPASGVIIADSNLNPANAMISNLHQLRANQITHIQRWSDAAYMSWKDACLFKNGDITNVRYIFRFWMSNKLTLNVILQAIQNNWNSGGGRGYPTIGTWGNGKITFTSESNPDEFHAILGSPNGVGSAYFLLTHKSTLGVKRISSVDIFVTSVPYTISSLDATVVPDSVKIVLLFYVEPVIDPVDS